MAMDFEKARKEIDRIDEEMAELFTRRMRAVEVIAEHKRINGMPIFDPARESEIIERRSLTVGQDIQSYYTDFIKGVMDISKAYQKNLIGFPRKEALEISLGERSYNIHIGRGFIDRAGELFDLDRKVLIITDDGVPKKYSETVKGQCRNAEIITLPSGEISKSAKQFIRLCEETVKAGLTRSDCIIAVGGGVVGDIAGYVASSYMRGIDFYNIPTTLLSQVDSSIGGKTAVNLGGVKNIIGSFYQPVGVIIDPDLLITLSKRQLSCGLAESVKMALTSDRELFELIEKGDIEENIEEIILRSLKIKKTVIEADEREAGIRKILNFGHTLGHAIESGECEGGLSHGECVAIGMLPVCSDKVRKRLARLLLRIGLPTEYKGDLEAALSLISHDKKCDGNKISVVFVDDIGSHRIEKLDTDAFCDLVREEIKK